MIKNLWDIVTFYCGNRHDVPIKMEIISTSKTPFYACPKYYSENREKTERMCTNRISIETAMKIVTELEKKIEEDGLIGANLNNYTFKYKTTNVKVIKHTKEKIDLEILDTKAIKGKII